jgi:DNA-binding response OmpR family regulator
LADDTWLGPVLVARAFACLPVIVLTAQHGENEEKALDLGAQDYLGKPVQTRSLLARVRAVLKRASS